MKILRHRKKVLHARNKIIRSNHISGGSIRHLAQCHESGGNISKLKSHLASMVIGKQKPKHRIRF